MRYRSEIDGLRAIAVVPVILFHAGVSTFAGGFVGVDVFFVISGFLITAIITEELDRRTFSVLTFYERRCRRILPALFFVVLACVPFALWWMNPFELKEFSQSVFATATFSSNVYFYLKTGYFDIASELKPLLHMWSLAVEEQYYLFFPLLLGVLVKMGSRWTTAVIATGALLSLCLSEFLLRRDPSANFYLVPTRVWELLVGAMAALVVQQRAVRPSQSWSAAGLAMILLAIFLFDAETPFPGVFAMVPVAGTVALLMTGTSETWTGRLLSHPILVGIGLISYSAYLWHQPLLAFHRLYFLRPPDAWQMVLLVASTFVLASISYRLIEAPFRRKDRFSRRQVFGFSGIGIAVLVTIGLAGHLSAGFPQRNPDFLRLAQNPGLNIGCSGAPMADLMCQSGADPTIALWGDSFAMHLAKALQTAYPDRPIHQLTLSACPPVLEYADAPRKAMVTCEEFNKQVIAYLHRSPGIRTVILSSSEDLTAPPLRERFVRTIGTISLLGMQVVLVSPTVQHDSTERCITQTMRAGGDFSACRFKLDEARNRDVFPRLERLARDLGVSYVDLRGFQCDLPSHECDIARDGVLLLRDSGHIAVEATTVLGAFFERLPVRWLPSRGVDSTRLAPRH